MERTFNVAIVGASGTVGGTVLSILQDRSFPVREIFPLGSSESAGKRLPYGEQYFVVRELADFDFSQAEIAIFCAGSDVSLEYVPQAVTAGCVVIDNTSAYRYEEDIPLVVPEVNPERVSDHTRRGIIASPGGSTIQLMLALKPIHDAVGIERINVATYQAVSGAGRKGVKELSLQTVRLLNSQSADTSVFTRQIAFNVIPHIDDFQDNGYTLEEMRLVWETRKILEDDNIMVNPTAVQVPVFYGHSEAVHLETREKLTAKQTRDLLRRAPGIKLVDKPENGGYPTPVSDSSGSDKTFVGRIREDISHPNGLDLWVVSDNVRKGAALNTVQIAEVLIKNFE